MDAGVDVKVESDDEMEPYDGSYAYGFCSESVRGTAALKCSQCSSNPVHRACVAGTKYDRQCATCGRETMEVWTGAGAGTAAPSEIIDLRDLVYIWRESGKEPRRWLDCSGSSGKGKQPAGADAGPEAEGDGAATSAGAGAVGRLNGSGSGSCGTRVAQAVGGRRRIRGERAAVTSRGT